MGAKLRRIGSQELPWVSLIVMDFIHIRIVGGDHGVEGFPVAGIVTANLIVVNERHVADFGLLGILHELRKRDLPVMTHARALLDYLPK
jgi:hypothetical protein